MKLELTEKGKKAAVGFNKSTKPLGERSQKDLKDLAVIAVKSGSKTLRSYFKELPSLEELEKQTATSLASDVATSSTENTSGATSSTRTTSGEAQKSP